MAKRHDGGPGVSAGRYGALLAGFVAVVVVISAGIYAGTSGRDEASRDTVASPRPPRNSAAPASAGRWVGSWAAAPAGGEPGTDGTGLAGRSVRNVVHSSVGGTSARVTLSNLYGQEPLTITHASLGVAAAPSDPTAAPGTLRRLTFGGSTSVVVPAGQQVLSDAVRLQVPHDADLLITTYSPVPSGPVTYHPLARQISYLADGDHTEDPRSAAYTGRTSVWRYVTAVDVLSNESDGTVVVLGDSLTDGITSTMGANRRWPDVLASRLRQTGGAPHYGIVNEGISGNRILLSGPGRPAGNPSALDRFQRDALDHAGVRAVVIDLGINDILRPPQQTDANRIVDGLRTLTRQAHARGLRVIGATLMPFQGHIGYQPGLESVREAVNARIRAGGVFDAVVDFDRALRDPGNPRRLRPQYDSGDHLHPSDLGFRTMGDVFDLAELRGTVPAQL